MNFSFPGASRRMTSRRIRPSATSFNSCMHLAPWHHTLQLLRSIAAMTGRCDAVSFTSSMRALSRDFAPWPLSLRLVTTDAKSLATAMATLSWRQASLLLVAFTASVDAACFHSAMARCQQVGEWPMALNFFQSILSTTQPNIISYNSTVSACCSWRWATHSLGEAFGLGLEWSLYSWTKLITVTAAHRGWQSAEGLLAKMTQESVLPSIMCFTYVQPWRQALKWMRRSRLDVTFQGMVAASCAEGGAWQGSLHLARGVANMNCAGAGAPNHVVLTGAALGACEKRGFWRRALQLLSFPEADTISIGAAMGACARAQR